MWIQTKDNDLLNLERADYIQCCESFESPGKTCFKVSMFTAHEQYEITDFVTEKEAKDYIYRLYAALKMGENRR